MSLISASANVSWCFHIYFFSNVCMMTTDFQRNTYVYILGVAPSSGGVRADKTLLAFPVYEPLLLTFFSNSTNASAEVSSGTPAIPEVKRSATLGAPRPDERNHHQSRTEKGQIKNQAVAGRRKRPGGPCTSTNRDKERSSCSTDCLSFCVNFFG